MSFNLADNAGLLALLLSMALAPNASAQPKGGDVFREYGWAHPKGDAGGSLRVGGKLDYGGAPIPLPHAVDLEGTTRAEVVIEKLLCHDGTRGLAIAFNGHPPIPIPEAPGIPTPAWDYQYFTYPVVQVPLSQLKDGSPNSFTLRVDAEHPWNWPQNLIHGLQLRVYYEPGKKRPATGRIVSPAEDSSLGRTVRLTVELTDNAAAVRRVDYLGLYEGINWEGDGNYRQWHYTYFKGALTNHLGWAMAAPWRASWDTAWLPEQHEPMAVAARITDRSGLIYLTEPVTGLTLEKRELSVELCKPYDVPAKWVTRASEKTQKFRVAGELKRAVAARFVWSSWSPGYMNGLFLNGTKVFDREGPRYACYWHQVPLADLTALRPGENTLTTGLTPKYDGKTVHGMEVNWPGIMVLIQYRAQP